MKSLKLNKYRKACASHIKNCTRYGCWNQANDYAHYSALYREQLGKGMGLKVHDYAGAVLCRSCHTEFDQFANENDEQNALDFLDAIFNTMGDIVATRSQFLVMPKNLKSAYWVSDVYYGWRDLLGENSDVEKQVYFLSQQYKYISENGE